MTDCEKLEEIDNEINVLIAEEVTDKSISFKAWYKKVKLFLQEYFGKNSIECMVFERTWHEFHELEREKGITDTAESVNDCKEILISIKKLFRYFLKEMSS